MPHWRTPNRYFSWCVFVAAAIVAGGCSVPDDTVTFTHDSSNVDVAADNAWTWTTSCAELSIELRHDADERRHVLVAVTVTTRNGETVMLEQARFGITQVSTERVGFDLLASESVACEWVVHWINDRDASDRLDELLDINGRP